MAPVWRKGNFKKEIDLEDDDFNIGPSEFR